MVRWYETQRQFDDTLKLLRFNGMKHSDGLKVTCQHILHAFLSHILYNFNVPTFGAFYCRKFSSLSLRKAAATELYYPVHLVPNICG